MRIASDYGQHVEAPEDRLIWLLLSQAHPGYWVALAATIVLAVLA